MLLFSAKTFWLAYEPVHVNYCRQENHKTFRTTIIIIITCVLWIGSRTQHDPLYPEDKIHPSRSYHFPAYLWVPTGTLYNTTCRRQEIKIPRLKIFPKISAQKAADTSCFCPVSNIFEQKFHVCKNMCEISLCKFTFFNGYMQYQFFHTEIYKTCNNLFFGLR